MRKLRNCRSKPRKTTQCPSETFEPRARWPFFGHPASCPYDTNSLSWRKKRGTATAVLLLFIANVKSFRKNNPSLLHLVFSQSAECPLSANGSVEAHGQIQLRVGYEDQSNRCPISKLLNLFSHAEKWGSLPRSVIFKVWLAKVKKQYQATRVTYRKAGNQQVDSSILTPSLTWRSEQYLFCS